MPPIKDLALPLLERLAHANDQASPIRVKLLVDMRVQGALLLRLALYAAACFVYFGVIHFFSIPTYDSEAGTSEELAGFFGEAIFWAPGLLLLVPLVAHDLLRFSNRFAGPVMRLRRELRRLVEREETTDLRFRNDDYWCELADDFNRLREELLTLRQSQVEDPQGQLRTASPAAVAVSDSSRESAA